MLNATQSSGNTMASEVTWAIQSNLLDETQVRCVWNAAETYGARVQEVVVIPFSDDFGNEIPDLGDRVIPYGSTKLKKMGMKRGWKGTWFDADRFRTDVWNRNRWDMLNQHALCGRVRDIGDMLKEFSWLGEDDIMFIRPVEDLKAFNGTVAAVKEIRNWMKSVYSVEEHTEISICLPQRLENEARYFIVDGKIVDGSIYRVYGQKISSRTIPELNAKIQRSFVDGAWLPHRNCVMDLAKVHDGYKVIEFNAINSPGLFYAHDIEKIIRAMTDQMMPSRFL